MTQEHLSLKEMIRRLTIDLAKRKCSLRADILDTGVSARELNPWRLQFFLETVNQRYEQCLNKICAEQGKLYRGVVPARKTKLIKLTSEQKQHFFNKNHLQGDGQGYCFGLVYNDRILSAMVIKRGPSNTSSKGAWELNRYATEGDFIEGGFDKLFVNLTKIYGITRWISYADLMISDGSLYVEEGWNLVERCKKDYKYLYKGNLYHKFNFRIKRFKEDKHLKFKEGLTEKQLAELNGLIRVWDCGKLKFEKIMK